MPLSDPLLSPQDRPFLKLIKLKTSPLWTVRQKESIKHCELTWGSELCVLLFLQQQKWGWKKTDKDWMSRENKHPQRPPGDKKRGTFQAGLDQIRFRPPQPFANQAPIFLSALKALVWSCCPTSHPPSSVLKLCVHRNPLQKNNNKKPQRSALCNPHTPLPWPNA